MARSDYPRANRHYRIARRTDRYAAIREREAGCPPRRPTCPAKIGWRVSLAEGKKWAYNADSGELVCVHQPPPRTYLWRLRVHKISTVIRPNSGWTAFISTWIIRMILLSASIGEPGLYRAFLYEASIRNTLLQFPRKAT